MNNIKNNTKDITINFNQVKAPFNKSNILTSSVIISKLAIHLKLEFFRL